MSYHFDPMKTIQATAVLLKRADQQRCNYLKTIKMLYMADRQSIKETGSPITGDKPVAMARGPVLSHTLDLIKDNDKFGTEELHALWSKYIRTDGYDIELVMDPEDDRLSDFEIETLESSFAENSGKSFGALMKAVHELPEWIETYVEGTSTEIHLKTILEALGMEDQYDELSTRRIEDAHFAKLFGD